MKAELNHTGISVVGDAPWGLHFSLFYQTDADLLDAIVPFFAAGLEAHELCVWAPSEPTVERAALEALRERIPDFDHHLETKSFELFSYEDFFRRDGKVDSAIAVAQLKAWERRARDEGFAGLRASGNLVWAKEDSWESCHEYERQLHQFLAGRRMMVVCTYPLASTNVADILDSAHEHHFVIARRDGEWDLLEVPELKRRKDELQRLNMALEQRVEQRNAQLSATNAELRRSETYLQHAQRLSHTGSFAGNIDERRTTFWSAETFRIFGFEPAANPPGRDEVVARIHPADRARTTQVFEEMARTRRTVELEFRLVRPDGSMRYVRGVSTPLENSDGPPTEFVGSLIDITEQKQATARLVKVKRAARERTLKAQFTATLEERTRLARDIHDTLLQGVTGIALKLRATLPNLGAAPRETVDSIRGIVELAESTIRDARRAVWDIRRPALVRNGLPAALEQELRRRANDVELRFELRGDPRHIPAAVEDAIFRVGQEAVINAATHAEAGTISVALSYEPQIVRLTVTDDGRGFTADRPASTNGARWGLVGMRERAERIDAPLVIRSAQGEGTTVELSVPVAPTRRDDALAAPRLVRRVSSAAPSPNSDFDPHADSRAHG